jgi:hypothetical protein
MPADLEPAVLIVAAVIAGFIALVLLAVRVMRWVIVGRHPEIAAGTTEHDSDASAGALAHSGAPQQT